MAVANRQISGNAQSGQTHRQIAGATTEIEHVVATDKFCDAAVDPIDMAQGKKTNAKIVPLGRRLQQAHPDIGTHAGILTPADPAQRPGRTFAGGSLAKWKLLATSVCSPGLLPHRRKSIHNRMPLDDPVKGASERGNNFGCLSRHSGGRLPLW